MDVSFEFHLRSCQRKHGVIPRACEQVPRLTWCMSSFWFNMAFRRDLIQNYESGPPSIFLIPPLGGFFTQVPERYAGRKRDTSTPAECQRPGLTHSYVSRLAPCAPLSYRPRAPMRTTVSLRVEHVCDPLPGVGIFFSSTFIPQLSVGFYAIFCRLIPSCRS